MPADVNCPATPPELPLDATPERVKLSPSGGRSPTSPGRASPDSACPICLGKVENKAFTSGCSHKFCFTCILEWSKVRAVCPLCKQAFTSIVHNVRSELDYDRYRLPQPAPPEHQHPYIYRPGDGDESRPPWLQVRLRRQYRYRSLVLPMLWPAPEGHEYHLPPVPSGRSAFAAASRNRVTSHSRRALYASDQWARPTADSLTGRYRETGPEFYRSNPACTHRLVPWLNRELNAVLDQPHLVAHVMEQIMGLITRMHILGPQFRAHLEPFISPHTEHFIHEFYSYARSPYDMVGYDLNVQYSRGRPAPPDDATAISSDSSDSDGSDSDIRVLTPPPRPRTPILEERLSPEPGPSGLSARLHHVRAFLEAIEADALDQSSDSDVNAVEVVDVLPPRHLRQYETVTLSSDDDAAPPPPPPPPAEVPARVEDPAVANGGTAEPQQEDREGSGSSQSRCKSSSRTSSKLKNVDSRAKKTDSRPSRNSKHRSGSKSGSRNSKKSTSRQKETSSRSDSGAAAMSTDRAAADITAHSSRSNTSNQTKKEHRHKSGSSKSKSHKSSADHGKERKERGVSKSSSTTQSDRAGAEKKRSKSRHKEEERRPRSRHHKRRRLSSDSDSGAAAAALLPACSRGASIDSLAAPSTSSSVPSTSSGLQRRQYQRIQAPPAATSSDASSGSSVASRRRRPHQRPLISESSGSSSEEKVAVVRRPAVRSAVTRAAGTVSCQLYSSDSDSDSW